MDTVTRLDERRAARDLERRRLYDLAASELYALAAVAQRAADEFAAGHTSAAACDILAAGARVSDAAAALRRFLDAD